jgi:hypothetical protein
MISKSIDHLLAALLVMLTLNACTETSGLASGGTSIDFDAAPSPSIATPQNAGAKTFSNDLQYSITLTRAYLVLTNIEVRNDCDKDFSVDAEDILNFFLPTAQAHTIATPTATGEPYVVNLLAEDNSGISIGSVSPPTGNYCGATIELIAADEDSFNLPTGAGEPDLVGKSLFIEASYTQSAANGGNSGSILINTSASLRKRELLLSPAISIEPGTPSAELSLAIQFDTWFNNVDLATLQTELTSGFNPLATNTNQMLTNITGSIHQR